MSKDLYLDLLKGFKEIAEDVYASADTVEMIDKYLEDAERRNAATDNQAEKEVVMEQDIFEIEDGVLLKYRGQGEKVVIPDDVRMISYDAFVDCTTLREVFISKNVLHIKRASFSGCENLECIIVDPENPVYHSMDNCVIETDANILVVGCKTSVIPSETSIIGEYAFYNCSGLASIEIPESVTVIMQYAFCECGALKSIRIPRLVKEIDSFAFEGNNFESIYVDKENVNYHSAGNCLIETAFKRLITGCKTSCIPNDGSVMLIDHAAFGHCTGLESIEIPDGVTCIAGDAFCDCSSLRSVVISKTVNDIFSYAFNYCESLENIQVDPENPVYYSKGNCLIERSSRTLVAGCKSSIIPVDGTITRIGDHAFCGCKELTKIEIPDVIEYVGHSAFWGCENLASVSIPVTAVRMEDSIFGMCDSLESIVVPGSVVNLGELFFGYCDNLMNVIISEGVNSIDDYAFDGCKSLRHITIPDSVTHIGESVFEDCYMLVITANEHSYAANYALEHGIELKCIATDAAR